MDIAREKPRSSRRRAIYRWLASAAVVLAVLGALAMQTGRAAPDVERSQLWIDTAQSGDMKREIRAAGTLVPRQIRWITAATAGSIEEVVVAPGARVANDTVILRLANPELESNLVKAEAALAGATSDVAAARPSLASQLLDQQASEAKAEADWRSAEVRARANERAHDLGIVSAVDLKQSQILEHQAQRVAAIETQRVAAFRETMAAQLLAAQARRDQAASALGLARQQIASLQVTAGIDGILQQVEVEPGQRIAAGAPLARVARPDELLARLRVSEVQAKDLALDQPAAIDTRDGIVDGRVVRVDPAVRDGSVAVDVAFADRLPAGARPDLSVEGRILLGTLPSVVSIARPANGAPDSAGSLFVIHRGEDIARRVAVQFGAASTSRIEVRAGVLPGDQVVLSDTSRWDDYDTLRLR